MTEAGPIDALGEPKDEQVVAGRPVIGPIQSHVTGCTADGRQDMQLFASGRVFFSEAPRNAQRPTWKKIDPG